MVFFLSVTKEIRPPKREALFCCQTRIRRSDCAYCNDCRSATLGKRTPSLSPSKRRLVGTPFWWVRIHEFINKTKDLPKGSLLFCCQTRIRTQTDRTRICSATVTPFGNTQRQLTVESYQLTIAVKGKSYFTRRSGIRAFLPVRARK